MNCMDFARKSETEQGVSEKDSNMVHTAPYADPFIQPSNQIPNEIHVQGEQKQKTSAGQMLLALLLIVLVCGAGIFVIAKFSDTENTKDEEATEVSYDDLLLDTDDSKEEDVLLEDSDESIVDEQDAYAYDESDLRDDMAEVYEADYDEIMAAGEPSNGYALFATTKDDIIPVMDQYFSDQDIEMNYESSMDNSYEMVDDEKITYYETYSLWSEADNASNMYFVTSDTVTGKLLYVGVYEEDNEKAIELVRKSLEIIDPSIEEDTLEETCDGIREASGYVELTCGEYGIYGEFSEESNQFYYYIMSLEDH